MCVIPSGANTRSRTSASYDRPVASASTCPSRPTPRLEYSNDVTGIARQLIARQEVVHLRHAVVGIRVGGIRGAHVVGHTRQTGSLLGEEGERDRLPVARRHLHRRGEELLHGIVEANLPFLDERREHGGGEHLGDRPDLEHGVAVERGSTGSGIARGDDLGVSVGMEHADDDAGGALLDDALLDDRQDRAVGQHGARGRWGG